jgi:cell division GTPase FtsZ
MVDVKDLLNNVADGDDKVDYKDSSSFFDDLDDDIGVPKIKIIGVGGAGNNIVKFLSAMRV